jgi:hypothetical protein
MPDHQKQPGRSDSDYLRQKAHQQEAEALREDLVDYFNTSSAVEDLRVKLGVMIEQALRKVVNEALQDQDIQATIRGQVADKVITGIREEIVSRQKTILGTVKGELLSTWQQDVREVVEQGIRQAREPRRPAPQAVQGPEMSPGAAGQGSPPLHPEDSPPVVKSRADLPPWLIPAVVGLGVGVLVASLVFYVSRHMQERPGPRRDDAVSQEQSLSRQATDVEAAEPDSQEQVFIRTMRVADAALPAESRLLDSLQERPYSDQYRCWFDAEARRQLDYLVEHRDLDTATFKNMLLDAYNGCVKREYQLGTNKLPVFAAQGTVHYLLRDQQKKGWKICAGAKEPAGLPDPRAFPSDGEVGRGTNSLLNGFLTCTGRAAQLQISQASTVEDYLFVVYAALKELERG